MYPIFKRFDIYRGTDFSYTFNYKDQFGNVVDLSAYDSALSQMRRSYESSNFYPLAVDISDSANGNITVSLEPSISTQMGRGIWRYDVILFDSLNSDGSSYESTEATTFILARGEITLIGDITQ